MTLRSIFFALLAPLLALNALAAAPPAPALIERNGSPNPGFWLTNVTFVWTNTIVRTPTIDLANVTVYGTNALRSAVVLTWGATPSAAGYRLYYGRIGDSTTNKLEVQGQVTNAIFYSSFSTGAVWWAYATAYNAGGESVPSTSIIFAP